MELNLTKNDIVRWVEGNDSPEKEVFERILWIDDKNKTAFVINIFDKTAWPIKKTVADIAASIQSGIAFLSPNDPFAFLQDSKSEYIMTHKAEIEKNWQFIQKAVTDEPKIYTSSGRGELIVLISERHKVSRKHLFKLIRRYFQHGLTKNSIAPTYFNCGYPVANKKRRISNKKRGRPSLISKSHPELAGINIDERTQGLLKLGYKQFYLKQKEQPQGEQPNLVVTEDLKEAYQKTLNTYFNIGYRKEDGHPVPNFPGAEKMPTYEQFLYWGSKSITKKQIVIARQGKIAFEQEHRLISGNSTQMALGPGHMYQVDVYYPKVNLLSFFDLTRLIGRPVLYAWIDVFSRMVVGIYLTLENPSWATAVEGLVNVFEDKVEYAKNYGITITSEQWPCQEACIGLLGDNAEFATIASDQIPDSLHPMEVSNPPAYRCDWKPIIERFWGKLKTKVDYNLPGAIKDTKKGMRKRDYRAYANLTYWDYNRALIYLVLHHNLHHRMDWYPRNADMIRDHVQPIPIELWNWGRKNISGYLRHLDTEAVKRSLLPKTQAVVTRSGILIEEIGAYYLNDSQSDWLLKAWKSKSKSIKNVEVIFDKRNPNYIYVQLFGGVFEKWHLSSVSEHLRGVTHFDLMDKIELEKTGKKLYQSAKQQAYGELIAHIDAIKKEAMDRAKNVNAGVSDAERVKQIRSNRVIEKELLKRARNKTLPVGSLEDNGHTESHIETTLDAKEAHEVAILKKLRTWR